MTVKRQPTIKGVTREYVGAALLKEIEDELQRLMKMYGVSRSWVIATILADAMACKAQPKYYALKPVKWRKKVS